jgi:hypothetical protein
MRTRGFSIVAVSAVLAALGLVRSAGATPVTMSYCVEDAGGGQYQYTFTLTLDNHDNSWAPGFGLGWIVYGDVPSGNSPISDFVGDPSSLPIGPFYEYSGSGGGHNGPTLGPVVVQQPPYPILYWVPNAVGDSLTWQGTSTHLVFPAQMQWSALFAQGGSPVNFENMTLCGPTGACCTPSGCQLLNQSFCSLVSGTYHGDGSACTTCPAVGACCSSSGCSILTAAACSASGGHYQGDNSVCPSASYTVGASAGAYTDISVTGVDVTAQVSNCDDGGTTVQLPFNFGFYGSSFNSVWFCTNGFLQFGGANRTDFGNGTPPSPADPGNAIYACWDDLYLCSGGAGGHMYYEIDGSAPNRTVTFSWQDVPKYSDQQNGSQHFQAVLHEGSNNIELRFGAMAPDAGGGGGPGGGDYTIGVENAGGTAAVTILGTDIGSGDTARLFTYTAPHCGPVCGSADFNCDGAVATDADIESFFACLAGSCPPPPCTSTADFNGDGAVATDQDIEAFFRVLAGGSC